VCFLNAQNGRSRLSLPVFLSLAMIREKVLMELVIYDIFSLTTLDYNTPDFLVLSGVFFRSFRDKTKIVMSSFTNSQIGDLK